MPEGDRTYKGLAVPLWGASEIRGVNVGSDIITITSFTGHTADFLVCQTAGGGEVFVIDDEGNVETRLNLLAGLTLDAAPNNYLRFSAMPTTAPTTGLTKGDFFIHNGNTQMGLALCISSAANTLRYFQPSTITFGRDTLA